MAIETVKLENILPNPKRDFDLYPINKVQKERLIKSIADHEMWAALPARKTENGNYEIAAGHHRLEAAKEIEGIEELQLDVRDYDDDDMIAIMIRENMTQRGSQNFGATIEAVAAVARQISQEIWDTEEPVEPPEDSTEEEKKAYKTLRGKYDSNMAIVTSKGVGRDAVAKRMVDNIGNFTVGEAIKVLKGTGMYFNAVLAPTTVKLTKEQKAAYNSVEGKMKSAYAAIASFSVPSHGVAFMKAVEKCKKATKAQYLSLALALPDMADKEAKQLSAKFITDACIEKFKLVEVDTTDETEDTTEDTAEDTGVTEGTERFDESIHALLHSTLDELDEFMKENPVESNPKLTEDPAEVIEKLEKALAKLKIYEVNGDDHEDDEGAEDAAEQEEVQL